MATLSPTSRKTLLFGGFGALFLLIAGYVALGPDDGLRQPLQYNHKIHVETAGLICTDCHQAVQISPSATIPQLETCSLCHSGEPISESPEERRLLEFVSNETEIPWKRVYRVPDHVYFSHRRHVTRGGLECVTCHGDVAEFTVPITAAVTPVTMKHCMDCHREHAVSNDCLTCHR
ncbi:MAG: cytochrome c3 family protein [Ignavibacteriales bacterium]|nr:cytochrome c3 family protein [Ignavibacteriales bacterium]